MILSLYKNIQMAISVIITNSPKTRTHLCRPAVIDNPIRPTTEVKILSCQIQNYKKLEELKFVLRKI